MLIAGDDDEMFMTRSLNVTPKKNRIAHLTARSDKSVACVTNNKRLYSTFCTVEAKTQSTTRPLRDSRASCHINCVAAEMAKQIIWLLECWSVTFIVLLVMHVPATDDDGGGGGDSVVVLMVMVWWW